MKTHKFARKTFYVDAVRLSEANFQEVTEWCKGEIKQDDAGHTYISVETYRPLDERQTRAYVGDWVLFAGSGYKVYTSKAFEKAFEKVKYLTKAQADEAGIRPPHEPRPKNEKKPVHGNKEQGLPSPASVTPKPAPPKHRRRPKPPRVGNVGKAMEEAQKKISSSNENPEAVPPAETPKPKTIYTDNPIPQERKSKADLEAEALIAEVKAISEKPEPR
jgi:hypothetical protein